MENLKAPVPTRASAEYWEYASNEDLAIPYCQDCDEYFFYPRNHCPDCMSTNFELIPSEGKGFVESYTTLHRAPSERYQEQAPYIIGVIELAEENVRMMSIIEAADEADIDIGTEVTVGFANAENGMKIPVFKPIS